MIAVWIDVRVTKIEAKNYDALWQCVGKLCFYTPRTYEKLDEVICQAVEWAENDVSNLPIGTGAVGLVAPGTDHAVAAILSTLGKLLPVDLRKTVGRYAA